MKTCTEATQEVGQEFTITTFDLGVCMKALTLIWGNPDDYRNHIILIGAFHTIMNYLKMVGHKMAGSGYTEIIVESGLAENSDLKGMNHRR